MTTSDEPRDWETLRSDALRAVTEVLEDAEQIENLAEEVTDAVLFVIDDERVRALCAEHIKNTYLRSMEFRNGASMEMAHARGLIPEWVGAARGLLDGAENYSETCVEFGIREDPQRYSFVVQKVGKLTPHEARRKAEAERDALRAENDRLRTCGCWQQHTTANPNLRTFTVTMNAKTCDGLDYSARDLAVAIIGEHMFADVDVTENEPAASGEQAGAVPESARKLPPGTEGCAWCWLDIVPDGEGGWRLLSDDSENPSHCNSQHCSRSKEGHLPGRWQNGGMVPIAGPASATEAKP